MNPSVSGFRAYFGIIFQDVVAWPNDFIQLHLDDCMIEVRPCVFGKYYLRALYYLTAHYLVIYKDIANKVLLTGPNSTAFASAKGVISSKSVGDLSMSMEMPEYNKTSDDKFLASTIFGQEFIRLRNKMTKGPLLGNRVPDALAPSDDLCYVTPKRSGGTNGEEGIVIPSDIPPDEKPED